MDATNNRLLEILCEKSFRYDPDFGFTLASGTKSDVYVDCKKTVLDPEGMLLTGKAMYELIKDIDCIGIGGLTLGADPLAYCTAMTANIHDKNLNVFIVRKEPKKHGTKRPIEGNISEGDNVIIVDDVVTTGGSTIKAIESCKEAGFNIVKVMALVDREEGGKENVEAAAGCEFVSVFTKSDLLNHLKK